MVIVLFTKLTPFRTYTGTMRCVALLLTFACALLAQGTAALAQCRLCGPQSDLTAPEANAKPMQLEVETSLDFDQVVLIGGGGGVARLAADGSRTTSGGLQPMSSRAMLGEIVIRGEPGRSIRVELPSRIDLFGGSGTLSISRISSNLPVTPRLDNDGRLRVRFGGELAVAGDAEGSYRGDVAITVDYL